MVHHELVPKYDGSFQIVKRVENCAYQLKLPTRIKSHLVFHINFLELFHKDEQNADQLCLVHTLPSVRAQFEYQAEKILNHKQQVQLFL